jgi:hypothetical protein
MLDLTREMAVNPAEFDLTIMTQRNMRLHLEKAVAESKRRREAQYKRYAK